MIFFKASPNSAFHSLHHERQCMFMSTSHSPWHTYPVLKAGDTEVQHTQQQIQPAGWQKEKGFFKSAKKTAKTKNVT